MSILQQRELQWREVGSPTCSVIWTVEERAYLETAVSSEETGVEVAMKKVVVVETLAVATAKDSDRGGGPVVCMKETRSMTFEVECGAFHKVPMSRRQTGLLGEEVHEI